jgi:hypothetical protein
MSQALRVAVLLFALLVIGLRAGAQTTLRPIEVGTTSKTANDWTTYIADRYGFFAANGIKPEIFIIGVNSGVAQQLTASAIDILLPHRKEGPDLGRGSQGKAH